MLRAIETISRIGLWLLMLVSGIAIMNDFWTMEMNHFQGLVLIALAILVVKENG